MKKIGILCVLLVVFSCNESILEEQSFDTLTEDSFFNNYEEANASLIGVYDLLSEVNYYKRAFLMITGYAGDEGYHNADLFSRYEDGTLLPTDGYVTGLWNSIFYMHGKANFTIFALSNTPNLSSDEKKIFLGRLRFIRALNLFNAVRLWGDIPLVKEYLVTEENSYPSRTPKSEVYAYIEEDLEYAIENLNILEPQYGFPTKGAAYGLLGKVYMAQDKWPEAKVAVDEVIKLGVYDLLPNYLDVFDVNNENNIEEIFSIQFSQDATIAGEQSKGSLLAYFYLPAFNTLGYAGDPDHPKGQMRVEHATYDRYTTGDYTVDKRNELFITNYVNSNTGATVTRYPENTSAASQGPAYSKYRDPNNSNDRNYDNNLIILRYADILLMKAEIENELNGPTDVAYDAFDEVRGRSNSTLITRNLNKDTFRDAISNERGIELFGEFQRYFDVLRMKKNGESYYKYYRELLVSEGKFTHAAQNRWALGYYPKYELMPIPSDEMALNPNINIADQNPGY
ncbi:hypothetical protein APS56_04575 [Pseudalgibacter alginicilyticus]|uniref:Carbohydrate-binding protein SusD n=2 Tax=Pseudalgibacter alginicilyticus TaxID=1736674 RepID=A0A0P0D6W8_9FLAO|nr:hypothetical protein APS56_04575 [Pseudalgibacter alginicilyticus]